MDKIEILSVDILNDLRWLVEEFGQVSQSLNIGLGWHYLLDLSWAAMMLKIEPGMRVLDAGAGSGVMQWWLAAKGVDVVSVDKNSRVDLGSQFREWCPVCGLRYGDLHPISWQARLRNFLSKARHKNSEITKGRGTITIYNQDLTNMPDIPDNSVDAVVSISALEHNSHEGLRACVAELLRVLKPGGKLIATLGSAKDNDWFHKPSKGWCYSEATLRSVFDLSADCLTNYVYHDELFEKLKTCGELRDNIADFYFKFGDNGMPWGKWDPKYQPVGVCKIK